MTKPLLLDLFCGAGGAAMGYHEAGFDVVGVDINPQPSYPFTFYQADVMTLDRYWLSMHDAIHASPPCQAYTALKTMHNWRTNHPELVDVVRAELRATRVPFVIENVPGAPMPSAARLCGTSFGLGVEAYDGWRELRRHRWFEGSMPFWGSECAHRGPTIGLYGDHARDRRRTKGERGKDFADADKLRLGREAMGMPWAQKWRELSEAIPPAYTRFIGTQLLEALERAA